MNLQVKKTMMTNIPVKAYKLFVLAGKKWYTGPFHHESAVVDEWVESTANTDLAYRGYHAFKARGGAEKAMLKLVRDGFIKHPTYVVPVQLKGKVSFGRYVGLGAHGPKGLKGVVGTQMRVRAKDLPGIPKIGGM